MNKPDVKKSWPKTKAKITVSDVKSKIVYTSDSSYVEYRLVLEYSYEVNKTKYKNFTYSNRNDIIKGSFEKIKKLSYPYSVGKEVDIYYNNENPQNSFINYEKINIGAYIISSLIFLIILPLFIIFAEPDNQNRIRRRRIRRRSRRSIRNNRTTISSDGIRISF